MNNTWNEFKFSSLSKLPKCSCVYFLMNDMELVYIGETNNLRKRVFLHIEDKNCTISLGGKKIHEDTFDSVLYIESDNTPERKYLEAIFLEDCRPKHNGLR